jgi:hypothetical protein
LNVHVPFGLQIEQGPQEDTHAPAGFLLVSQCWQALQVDSQAPSTHVAQGPQVETQTPLSQVWQPVQASTHAPLVQTSQGPH